MAVIDASAALYLLASEEDLAPFANVELVAPALLWSETTSVVNEMRWRREISDELATTVLDRLLAAPIARRANAALYRQATDVARSLGWAKTYDAEYVALARMLRTPLITRDARLRKGAARVVQVVGPDELARLKRPFRCG